MIKPYGTRIYSQLSPFVRIRAVMGSHMNTPLKSEPSKFEWQWCFLYKFLFEAAFWGRIFYFLIGLQNRKMKNTHTIQIKGLFSNPCSPITRHQDSRILLNIHAPFVRESCIESWREGGVCCKIPCNHQWLGAAHPPCDISFYTILLSLKKRRKTQ